jgi:hypothetical protein
MKSKFGIAVVACVALFVSACGSGPNDLIVGKWEAGEGGFKIIAEFTKDSKAKITMMGKTLEGTYKLSGDGDLEWTMNGTTTKSKVKVSKTEMELNQGGQTITYRKV